MYSDPKYWGHQVMLVTIIAHWLLLEFVKSGVRKINYL